MLMMLRARGGTFRGARIANGRIPLGFCVAADGLWIDIAPWRGGWLNVNVILVMLEVTKRSGERRRPTRLPFHKMPLAATSSL